MFSTRRRNQTNHRLSMWQCVLVLRKNPNANHIRIQTLHDWTFDYCDLFFTDQPNRFAWPRRIRLGRKWNEETVIQLSIATSHCVRVCECAFLVWLQLQQFSLRSVWLGYMQETTTNEHLLNSNSGIWLLYLGEEWQDRGPQQIQLHILSSTSPPYACAPDIERVLKSYHARMHTHTHTQNANGTEQTTITAKYENNSCTHTHTRTTHLSECVKNAYARTTQIVRSETNSISHSGLIIPSALSVARAYSRVKWTRTMQTTVTATIINAIYTHTDRNLGQLSGAFYKFARFIAWPLHTDYKFTESFERDGAVVVAMILKTKQTTQLSVLSSFICLLLSLCACVRAHVCVYVVCCVQIRHSSLLRPRLRNWHYLSYSTNASLIKTRFSTMYRESTLHNE